MLRTMTLIACLLAAPALAQNAVLTIANDRYEAGASVRFDGPRVSDVFLAGNRITVAAPVAGSAHLAARRVAVDAPVTGDVFAAGFGVTIAGSVGGDASVTGYEVTVGPVTGNLRVAAAEVTTGSVGGYAVITGAEVALTGAIAGDAVLVADTVSFGPEARVAGALTIYAADPALIVVPETVAPADRVRIEQRAQYYGMEQSEQKPRPQTFPVWQMVIGFLFSVLMTGVLASVVIAVAPVAVQSWRQLALAQPGRATWSGFLVLSALAGSGFVLTMTLVGVILLPVMLTVTWLAALAGYVLGSYLLGVGIWLAVGRPMPDVLWGKFLLACLGALLTGLAWLVPVVGWIFVLGLILLGVGTLAAFVLPDRLLLRPATPQA